MKPAKLPSTLLLLAFLLSNASHAQQFWLTTPEFQGGPKTAIALKGDSTIFVATASGIIRSYNQAYKFDTCFTNPNIFSLLITANQHLLAGGVGKIYRSTDNGHTWDSAVLNNNFGIMKMLQLPNGHLFATSGALDATYTGAGVYYSDDDGVSWAQRNTGLGNLLFADGLAADKNNRLYVTTADELSTGNAGLFYSDNEGQQWNHVDISFNGQNAIEDELQVTFTCGLSVAPNDSIYHSFEGVANNTGVRLNLRKHIADVSNNSKWDQYLVNNTNMFWMDRALGDIHFAQNGDWYSSHANTINLGGTYFRKNNTTTWHRHDEGLGLDVYLQRNWQRHVETSNGKIFMVQNLDERIYVTDTSRYTPTAINETNNKPVVTIYPNPQAAGASVAVAFDNEEQKQLTLLDITGKLMFSTKTRDKYYSLKTPDAEGLYILHIQQRNRQQALKLVVY
ncbi:MAG TPA: T9SS type A sorting domain-containing protein [Chitinophagales bacterium]|nr:T9SS type A sorting domain-containing protein [Chitinophagales bacterium]